MSSSALASATKKRKKTQDKAQSQQLNKCLNEKRRREQENTYIEELAELISESFADMSSLSVKPDKCAILQETVSQIRRIKQLEAQSGDAVQQGEVSSSKPALIGHQVFGPLLLEALEGFVFVVTSEGKVEFITDTVSQFTRFTKEDVLGKSIYNFLHHGDHARFSSGLLPMTLGWQPEGTARSRTFNCRLLIKPPDDQDETMEEKQQRVSKYEAMQISSMLISYPPAAGAPSAASSAAQGAADHDQVEPEGGPSMMCVARRMPQADFCPQFTTKLDKNGVVLSVDSSGVGLNTCPGVNRDLIGRNLHQLVMQCDAPRLTSHINDVLANNTATSELYRLAINPTGPPVSIQTKSRLFKGSSSLASPPSQLEPDFIMATHTVMTNLEELNQTDSQMLSASTVTSPAMVCGGGSGESLDCSPQSRHAGSSQQAIPAYASELLDFELFNSAQSEWPTGASTASAGSGSNWSSPPPPKPSPQQVMPHQTPTWDRATPSPRNHPWEQHSTPCSPVGDEEMPGRQAEQSAASSSKDSARLRNLLTNRPSQQQQQQQQQQQPQQHQPTALASSGTSPRNSHLILKGLLNQNDDEDDLDASTESAMHIASSTNAMPASNSSAAAASSSTSSNNMLLKLLNDKTDDDEGKSDFQRKNELLNQLLIKDDESEKSSKVDLLHCLGFSNTSPSSSQVGECSSVGSGTRKRPSLESDDGAGGKRLQQAPMNQSPAHQLGGPSTSVSSAPSQVSSTGRNSKLCERNKMLALLLAQEPKALEVPRDASSLIHQTPNPRERLLKCIDSTASAGRNDPAVGRQSTVSRQLGQMQQTQQQPKVSPGSTSVVAPQPPQPPISTQPNVSMPLEGTAGPSQRMEAADSSGNTINSSNSGPWDSNNDKLLSDILDSVIDIVPDGAASGSLPDYMDSMDSLLTNELGNASRMMGGSASNADTSGIPNGELSKKMAINAIQKSLIEYCEKAVKSPPQYTAPPMQPPSVFPTQAEQRIALNYGQPPQAQTQNQQPVQPNTLAAAVRFATQASMTQVGTQRRKQLSQQQQLQKQRLLQQQRNTQVLLTPHVKQEQPNMEALIRNTGMPPNVTLQRSASVPDSQMSPGYSPLSPSQQRPPQQQQQQQQHFHAFNSGFAPNQVTRLSPLPGAVGNNALPNFQQQQQLSPRVGQQGIPQQQWAGQEGVGGVAATRLTMQQQQNPMLNAQLTFLKLLKPQQNSTRNVMKNRNGFQGAYPQTGTRMAPYGQVQRPALGGGARSSPFTPDAGPPSSPGSAGTSSPGLFQAGFPGASAAAQQQQQQPAAGGGGAGGFNPQMQMQLQMHQQQQQLRLQRAMSHPAGAASNGPQMQNVAGWHAAGLMGYSPPQQPPPPPKHQHHHQHLHHYQQQPNSPLPYAPAATSEHSSYDHPSSPYQYPPPPPLPHRTTQLSPGANNGMPSEFVMQKLRAAVSAGNQQQQHQQQPMQAGAMVSSPRPQPPPPQQQQMVQLGVMNSDELLGMNYEMDPGSKIWDSPASNAGQQPQQQMGAGPSSVREEPGMRGGGSNQSSLLQKLLSE
ncbi:Hypothetical predicted protein [Cloeon dipterum]|uniref:Nuclear receptor coactivator 2 n=1 Tax=Cloeon dipterum TaxID=197152 RepID=A0A8S1DFT2_9INSE|nr:Hypothetical predicted protein [Cloeon dipterum]